MVAFGMVMLDELADGAVERSLPEEDHLAEAFGLDGSHESFGMGIQVRGASRQHDGFDAALSQHGSELFGELGIAIEDEMRGVGQDAVFETYEVEGGLLDEEVIRVRRRTDDGDAPCFEADHEESVDGDETPCRPDLGREEVCRRKRGPVSLQELRPVG